MPEKCGLNLRERGKIEGVGVDTAAWQPHFRARLHSEMLKVKVFQGFREATQRRKRVWEWGTPCEVKAGEERWVMGRTERESHPCHPGWARTHYVDQVGLGWENSPSFLEDGP